MACRGRRAVEREDQRFIHRDVWLAAGKQGVIGLAAPEHFGGEVATTDRYRMVLQEELGKAFATSLASSFSLRTTF